MNGMMTDQERDATGSDNARICVILTELAECLEGGLPLWHALPQSFIVAGIDPLNAVVRLASREWRVTTLLNDLLPPELLERVRQGEDDATLVAALRAAALLP